MTRQARIKGEDAVYHVIQRGNERKEIFRGDDDKQRYLETLKIQQEKHPFKLYAYCLMDKLKNNTDLSYRQIAKYMGGLSVSTVHRVLKNMNKFKL